MFNKDELEKIQEELAEKIGQEVDDRAEGMCRTCRFFLNLNILPFMNQPSRCLLTFEAREENDEGKCVHWQPASRQTPDCFSCRFGMQGGPEKTLCSKGWVLKDDGEHCDEWEERR